MKKRLRSWEEDESGKSGADPARKVLEPITGLGWVTDGWMEG